MILFCSLSGLFIEKDDARWVKWSIPKYQMDSVLCNETFPHFWDFITSLVFYHQHLLGGKSVLVIYIYEMVSLLWQAPIGIRLWRHIREENARKRVITFIIIAHCTLICLVLARNHKEQTNHCIYSLQGGFYMDPFAKRNVTSCLGIPLGGIG